MDTSKMQHFEALSTNKIFDLLVQSEEIQKDAEDLHTTLDQAFVRNLIAEIVGNYDLGVVKEVYEIFGGYVNRSFGIYTEKDGQTNEYFVRMYKKGVTEKEILFEHSLITFVKENGLEMAAGIFRANDGKSFVKQTVGSGENVQDRYFAIYEYLPGEDKYTWVDNIMTDAEYASAARVLATFHNAARNFDPQGLERVEPKIMELIPTLKGIFKGYLDNADEDKFTEYFRKNFDAIMEVIDRTTVPAEELAQMPQNPIHCDFHPGNLKYVNEQATGIFDFDWSKIDLRLFELGLGIVYCCASWVDDQDGTLMMDQVAVFLKAYQKKLQEENGLAPLNEVEKRHLPTLLAAGNMYLVFWCLRSYYSEPGLNVFEYLVYLQHQIKLMNWIEAHRAELLELANTI